MYQCFHCLHYQLYGIRILVLMTMVWNGEGIVHHCHCGNCGAEIDYYVADYNENKTK